MMLMILLMKWPMDCLRQKGYEWGVVDKNGQIIADFVYFTAHLGDGEYIALTKEIDSTTRELIVLDSSGKLVNREVYEGGLRFLAADFTTALLNCWGGMSCL